MTVSPSASRPATARGRLGLPLLDDAHYVHVRCVAMRYRRRRPRVQREWIFSGFRCAGDGVRSDFVVIVPGWEDSELTDEFRVLVAGGPADGLSPSELVLAAKCGLFGLRLRTPQKKPRRRSKRHGLSADAERSECGP
jgi:hypothetical protein